MISNIKTIIQLISLVLEALKFIRGEINEAKFNHAVKSRKKAYDTYMDKEKSERERLEALRGIK